MTCFESFNTLMATLYLTIPLMLNMGIILWIIIFIYSIYGCFLFSEVIQGKIVDDYINFKNFIYGMMTLFRCATAEDWIQIMKDHSKDLSNCIPSIDCGSSTFIFFISLFNNIFIFLFFYL